MLFNSLDGWGLDGDCKVLEWLKLEDIKVYEVKGRGACYNGLDGRIEEERN